MAINYAKIKYIEYFLTIESFFIEWIGLKWLLDYNYIGIKLTTKIKS